MIIWDTDTSNIPYNRTILFGNAEWGVDLGHRLPNDPDIIYTASSCLALSEVSVWTEIPNIVEGGKE